MNNNLEKICRRKFVSPQTQTPTESAEAARQLKKCYCGDEVDNPMHLMDFTNCLSSELDDVVKRTSCIHRLREEMEEPEKLWGIDLDSLASELNDKCPMIVALTSVLIKRKGELNPNNDEATLLDPSVFLNIQSLLKKRSKFLSGMGLALGVVLVAKHLTSDGVDLLSHYGLVPTYRAIMEYLKAITKKLEKFVPQGSIKSSSF